MSLLLYSQPLTATSILSLQMECLLEQSGEEPLEVVIQDVEKKTLVMLYLVITILLHLSEKR